MTSEASLNYRDLAIARGKYHVGFAPPLMPVSDGAGEAVRHRADPYQELLAQLTWIVRYIASGDYRGCAFINTATEFLELDRAARVIGRSNKRTLRTRLLSLVAAIGVPALRQAENSES